MLPRLLRPRSEAAFTLLRVVTGLLFTFHGLQKAFGLLSEFQPAVGSQMWIGGVIELTTGLLMAAGLLTTWAAFLASGEMAVAYIQFHWKLALGAQLIPVVNHGESAVVYAVLFLYVACRGAGPWSLDAWLQRRRHAGGPAPAALDSDVPPSAAAGARRGG